MLGDMRFCAELIGTLLTVIGLAAGSLVAQEDDSGEERNPYEWTFETYEFPVHGLVGGFASPERGALKPPAYPGDEAGDEEMVEFLRKSNSIVSHYLEIEGLALPKGSLVAFDPESLTLAARLPRISQSSVAFTAESLQNSVEKYIALRQLIFEAPGDVIRDMLEIADGIADHAEALEFLGEAVARGEGEILESSVIQLRSGNRGKVERFEGRILPTDLVLGAGDTIEYLGEWETTGTSFEADPVLGADHETIDLNFMLDHHYAPVMRREVPLTIRGGTDVAAMVDDSFNAVVTTQITTKNGMTRLIGVWRPEGLAVEPGEEVLHAAFLEPVVVKVLPLINDSLVEMLKTHGGDIIPIPEGELEYKQVADEIPEGMIVRRFVVPPTFLSVGAGGGDSAMDPFSAVPESEPRFTIRATAQDILKSAGIFFPPGSSANYLRQSSTLVVRNTPEQIEMVEAYIMSIRSGVEKMIALTLHLVEAPGGVLRQAAKDSLPVANHAKVWERLKEEEGFTYLNTTWFEARSGNRAKVEAGRNYHFLTAELGANAEAAKTEKGEDGEDGNRGGIVPEIFSICEEQRVGTVVEADPVLGADNVTIDVNISVDYDYGQPEVSGDAALEEGRILLDGTTVTFRKARVVGSQTMRSGSMRLIGMWRPQGLARLEGEDRMQAAFLKAVVVPLEVEGEE